MWVLYVSFGSTARCACSGRSLACGNWKFWWAIRISMVAHRASGNKINNIMVVREFLIVCAI